MSTDPALPRVRRFEADDAPTVARIFYRSIHEVARRRYSAAQCDAWAPAIPDHTRWLERLCAYETFVGEDAAGVPVAWISMSETGYVDMLFCLPEGLGTGVASALYRTVEDRAIALCIRELTVHASLLAEPFFAKRGWAVDHRESPLRRGVALPRAAMSKNLSP